MEDIVRTLGYLCLGTRLKRIGEQVQADTQRIMEQRGVTLQAGQYPLLAAIDRLGPLSIGELAEALGVTQPRISALMRGKIGMFSLDSLINMLTALGLKVDIRISEAA